MTLTVAATLCLLGGCQGPTAKLSDGRQVTLADMEREVTEANGQFNKTSARITAREWEYRDEMLLSDRPTIEEIDPVVAAHSRNLNAYQEFDKRYLFDAVKVRQVTYTKDLRDFPALTRLHGLTPSDAMSPEWPSIRLDEWTAKQEKLSADMFGNEHLAYVVLHRTDTRVPPSMGGTWAELPLVPKTSLLSESDFLADARTAGAAMEVVHEDGLELVKVSWRSFGYMETGWFRSDMGYRMHRLEVRNLWGGDRLAWRTEARDYRVINGVCYPFKYETIRFDSPGNRQLSFHRRIEIKQAEFGCQFADDEFRLKLPAGAALYYAYDLADTRHASKTATGGDICAASRPSVSLDAPVKADIGELFRLAGSRPMVQ